MAAMGSSRDHVRWDGDASARVLGALGARGVVRLITFGAHDPELVVVWLVTTTDGQKTTLLGEWAVVADLVERLVLAAEPDCGYLRAGVAVESEETVDREYSGDWWSVIK